MSSSLNRALLVLLGVGLLAGLALLDNAATGQQIIIRKAVPAGVAVAPPGVPSAGDPNNPDEMTSAISYPTDNKLKRRLEAAQDFINEEDWGKAAEVLQGLLNIPEDMFVQVGRKGPDGKEVQQWVSVRAEANRLLASLPPKGMEFYRLQYGPKATELLNQAKAAGDPALLARVAQCFLYTDAGAEATNLLGTYHLDRGNFVMAAESFKRLLERPGTEKVTPLILFKAFLAFSRCNDKTSEQLAEETWQRLTAAAPEGLRFGDRLVSLGELRQQKEKYGSSGSRDPNDWTMFGGGPSRSAQAVGSTPFLERKWFQPTIRTTDTRRYVVDQAVRLRESRGDAILPAFFPIAAKGKLIYRSYWGIHAVDLKKDGKLVWETPSAWSLDRMLGSVNKAGAANQWINLYFQMSRHHVLFENSTVGTLSTDNSRVYAVEDLALPPVNVYPYGNPWGANPNLPWGPEINRAIQHNRLQAFDLDNGKLLWEVGGPTDKKDDHEVKEGSELKDSYFLGPPLPLGGKLYVLNEKNQELRLVCLDAAKGHLNWVQTLATTRDKLMQDVGRRIQAAQLSYGEGVLVCPTNAGAILGVDLLTHSLVWVYAYRERPTGPSLEEEQLFRQGLVPRRGLVPGITPVGISDWKTSAPIITDGKVVFTGPDATSIHCLSLRDGSLLWKSARADKDLYLAGVYNGKVLIVGKESVRALALADGRLLWQLPTGLPSGRGIASENIYYLPLKAAAQSKEPEVCAIDLEKGVIAAHTKSRKKEVPGNLLFYEGDVISQTVDLVCAYPQLKVKEAEMTQRIAANPNDPIGLTERGELRLDRGDLIGAVDDLRTALANNPPAAILPKTRLKLYETLTELLQRDFNTGEKYLDEYRALCQVEIDPRASAAERQELEAEQQRRQANYLCLLAKGREAQGRLVEAFDAYQEFGVLAANKELISVVDEPAVKARPDVWAQGRIAAMAARATPEQRKPLEERIAQKYREVKEKGDLEELRRFVGMFGSLFDVGKEAWLSLAERLVDEEGSAALLEAERHLLVLRHQKDDPQLAARAVEALARLMARKGLLEDAAYYYRILGKEFAQVEVRDGKTGADLFDELATDKRFLPYLDEPGQVWHGGKIRVEEQRGIAQPPQPHFSFQPAGEPLPFFQKHRVALNLNFHQFKLLDRATGEEKWSQKLTPTNFQSFIYAGQPTGGLRFLFHNLGHLVVLPVGHMVFGIDPVNKQVLWEKNLFGTSGIPAQSSIIPDPRDGTLQIVYQDGWVQRLGQTGPVQPSYVCLQTREGLTALEPVSGKVLWVRGDISPRSHVFGDDQYLFIVETNADGSASTSRALRAYDGVSVKVPDFAALYQRRIRILGRNLLLSDTDRQGNVSLRLYDVLTAKDLFQKTFGPGAVVLQSEDPNLAGVVEADGRVSVIDLTTRTEVFPVRDRDGKAAVRVDPKHLHKAQAVHLLHDRLNFYLAINGPNDANVNLRGGPWSNLVPGSGIRALPVNGEVYAFERDSGALRWRASVPQQMLVLEHFADLPIMLFTAQRWGGAGGNRFPVTAVKSIDKRTGKLLYDPPEMVNGTQFYALNLDLRAGRIDLLGYNIRVTHYLVGAGTAEAGGTGGGPASANRGAAGARTGAAPGVGVRPPAGAVEAARIQAQIEAQLRLQQELLRRQQELELLRQQQLEQLRKKIDKQ